MENEEELKEVEKASLKIETVGDRGVSITASGDEKGLFVKTALILQSLVVSNVISAKALMHIAMNLQKLEDEDKIDSGVQEHLDLENPDEEALQNYKNKIEEYENRCKNTAIKRKCLICPEKDTCKNKQIDIQCNKY